MKEYTINKKYEQFNDFIRGELKRRKLSQASVAHWLNLPQTSISQRLSGTTDWTLREIMSLFELMEIEHEWTEKRSSASENRTSQIKDV